MKLHLSGVGADPKKTIALGALLLVLVYVFYSNVIAPSDDIPAHSRQAAAASAGAATAVPRYTDPEAAATPAPEVRARPSLRPGQQKARFEFKMTPKDQRPDPTTVDPTLRLDLLDKVQSVLLQGGDRNLFQYSAAPLPPVPEPKIIPNSAQGKPTPVLAAAPPPPADPVKPPPPPIPLRFYGYSSPAKQQTGRRAFFLDGDEIVVAGEGQLIKNRYKVVSISINSVVVEDTQYQNQQTLPLEEVAG